MICRCRENHESSFHTLLMLCEHIEESRERRRRRRDGEKEVLIDLVMPKAQKLGSAPMSLGLAMKPPHGRLSHDSHAMHTHQSRSPQCCVPHRDGLPHVAELG